jgi:hypothetical protein
VGNNFKNTRFEILTAVLMMMIQDRLDMTPCRIAMQDYIHSEEEGSKHLRNVGNYLPIYVVSYCTKLKSSRSKSRSTVSIINQADYCLEV